MKGFDLHEPTTVTQAVGLLDQLGATGKVLAGGSDLVGGIFKDWVAGKGMPLPSALVDITAIPDLKGIKPSSTGISVISNGLSLAAHFGDGTLRANDVAAGLVGAVVKDPVQDRVVWQEYLETVVKERDGWKDLYRACRETL